MPESALACFNRFSFHANRHPCVISTASIEPAVWERTITTLVCFVGHTTASRGPARSCLSSPQYLQDGAALRRLARYLARAEVPGALAIACAVRRVCQREQRPGLRSDRGRAGFGALDEPGAGRPRYPAQRSKPNNHLRDNCPEAQCPEVQCPDFNPGVS